MRSALSAAAEAERLLSCVEYTEHDAMCIHSATMSARLLSRLQSVCHYASTGNPAGFSSPLAVSSSTRAAARDKFLGICGAPECKFINGSCERSGPRTRRQRASATCEGIRRRPTRRARVLRTKAPRGGGSAAEGGHGGGGGECRTMVNA